MYISTAPTVTPTRPTYSVASPYASGSAFAGEAISSLAGQAMGIYDLIGARRNIDRVLAAGDVLAAAGALTPIGPYLAASQLAKHLTVTLVDRAMANRARNRAERHITRALQVGRRRGEGQDPALAAYVTARTVAPLAEHYGDRSLVRIVRRSPFYPGPGQGPDVARDPLTGHVKTLSQLLAEYGPGRERIAQGISNELFSRPRIGAGFLPSILAPYRRAAA